MDKVLGIDIGGTSIKVGMFSTEGKLEAATQIPTGEIVSEAAFAVVTEGLKKLLDDNGSGADDVVGVGLDVPGPVDDDGKVGMLANIELDPEGLQAALRRTFPRANLAFVNDANAAALGELWQGTAKDASSFVLVAIGTGVGGGVVTDGKIVSGAFGAGGEIGHITVNREETATCGCGRQGCLEQYASASGIVRVYKQVPSGTPETKARGFSKLKLVAALKESDKWVLVKTWIEERGLWDYYLAAQNFREDNEMFSNAVAAIKEYARMSDEDVEAILKNCIYEED